MLQAGKVLSLKSDVTTVMQAHDDRRTIPEFLYAALQTRRAGW